MSGPVGIRISPYFEDEADIQLPTPFVLESLDVKPTPTESLNIEIKTETTGDSPGQDSLPQQKTKKHTKSRGHKCTSCSKSFLKACALLSHFNNDHPDQSKTLTSDFHDSLPFSCNSAKCKERAATVEAIENHIKTAHAAKSTALIRNIRAMKQRLCPADGCGVNSNRAEDLKRHIGCRHPAQIDELISQLYKTDKE